MLYDPASAQSFPGLLLLGIAVLASLRLFYYGRTEDPEDALHLSMSVVGRVMIAIGLLETCLLFLNVLVVLLVFAMLAVAAVEYWRRRASRQASLLGVLAAAVEKSMPLSPAIEAFSLEWRGGFGARSRLLARQIADGAPLSEALQRIGGLASAKALAVIAAGEATGVLGPAVSQAAALHVPRSTMDKIAAVYWYLLYTSCIMGVVMTFCMIKIVPAMIKIFDDFDTELPGITVLLINAADLIVVAFPFVLLLGFSFFAYLSLRYIGLIGWDLPFVAGLVRRWNMATVLRTAALAAAANQPLETALAALARRYPNTTIRRRLTSALGEMSLGADWCDGLQAQGLLCKNELGLLKAATRAGNLPWALQETAAGLERRCVYRLWACLQLLAPAMILALGGLTCFIVIGLFAPLVKLIEHLT